MFSGQGPPRQTKVHLHVDLSGTLQINCIRFLHAFSSGSLFSCRTWFCLCKHIYQSPKIFFTTALHPIFRYLIFSFGFTTFSPVLEFLCASLITAAFLMCNVLLHFHSLIANSTADLCDKKQQRRREKALKLESQLTTIFSLVHFLISLHCHFTLVPLHRLLTSKWKSYRRKVYI